MTFERWKKSILWKFKEIGISIRKKMSKIANLNVKSNSNPTHGKEKLIKTISELPKTGTQHRTYQNIKLIIWKASW